MCAGDEHDINKKALCNTMARLAVDRKQPHLDICSFPRRLISQRQQGVPLICR